MVAYMDNANMPLGYVNVTAHRLICFVHDIVGRTTIDKTPAAAKENKYRECIYRIL